QWIMGQGAKQCGVNDTLTSHVQSAIIGRNLAKGPPWFMARRSLRDNVENRALATKMDALPADEAIEDDPAEVIAIDRECGKTRD
ncbi:MAG: hypothetical protein WCI94_17110, partial [Rhodospirillales bacterium]